MTDPSESSQHSAESGLGHVIATAWHDSVCPEGPECRDHALHVDSGRRLLPPLQAVVDAVKPLLAAAWDAGFMNAAGQDHPAYPRTRTIRNPYLEGNCGCPTTPVRPAQ